MFAPTLLVSMWLVAPRLTLPVVEVKATVSRCMPTHRLRPTPHVHCFHVSSLPEVPSNSVVVVVDGQRILPAVVTEHDGPGTSFDFDVPLDGSKYELQWQPVTPRPELQVGNGICSHEPAPSFLAPTVVDGLARVPFSVGDGRAFF